MTYIDYALVVFLVVVVVIGVGGFILANRED